MARNPLNLSRRERQLIEILYRLEEASVAKVLGELEDPPSYSSVRALLNELVRKEQLSVRQDGKRYLYRPLQARKNVAKSLLRNLVSNFFRGSSSEAICALLDDSKLTSEQLEEIKKKIANAEGKKR